MTNDMSRNNWGKQLFPFGSSITTLILWNILTLHVNQDLTAKLPSNNLVISSLHHLSSPQGSQSSHCGKSMETNIIDSIKWNLLTMRIPISLKWLKECGENSKKNIDINTQIKLINVHHIQLMKI